MKPFRAAFLAMAVIGLAMVASPAHADFSSLFPTSSSTPGGAITDQGADFGFFFRPGDSVSQTYTGTGDPSVVELRLDVNIDQNFLNSGGFVNIDVLVNGVTVGSFTHSDTDGTGVTPLDFTFAPIVGNGTYTLMLNETNLVPSGLGSIAIAKNSEFTLLAGRSVPEPSSLALLGLGVAAVIAQHRRRRRQAA
jgi:PEP-CTERM motif